MKKIAAILLAAVMLCVCSLAGAEYLAGGWNIPEDNTVTQEVQAAFDKAFADFTSVVYKPLQLLATQVVAGTNYCVLCRGTDVSTGAANYGLAYIYADLQGGACLMDMQILNIGMDYTAEEEDGQNPVMNFIGEYQDETSQRACMTISAMGEGSSAGACIEIEWANDAESGVLWTLFGTLDTDTMVITYHEGEKADYTCDEKGEMTLIPENLAMDGEFIINEDGSILWNDKAENAGEGCRFVFAW